MTGLEALVRWRHRERGLLDPADFVSIAEDSGLIEPIGRWVQERAARQILEWHELRPDDRPLDVAVNLSARQVAHRDLAANVAEMLARTGLDPVHLRLEITETVAGRGVGDGDRLAGGAERARRPPRPRRLRHRLLLARLPQPLPLPRAEDRPLLRRHARRRTGGDGDRRGGDRDGPGALPRRDRRGGRERGAARRAAPARVRLRPGPPLPRGAAAGGDQPADRRPARSTIPGFRRPGRRW